MQRRKLVVQISQFPMKELIRRAKEERKSQPCRVLEDPPDNGLLVPELVHVAHRVHRCRASLLSGLSTIIHHHIQRFCFEVHIGKEGHEILFTFMTVLSNLELSTTSRGLPSLKSLRFLSYAYKQE
ncbi:unnamed protein product [Brassica oleracea]